MSKTKSSNKPQGMSEAEHIPKKEPKTAKISDIKIAEKGSLPNTIDVVNNVIFASKAGAYYIRNFEDMIPSTITMVAFFDGEVIDLDKLFWCLPCVKYTGNANIKYPAGTISSVRWKEKYRGAPGKFFRNNVTVDLWTKSKRVSVKISAKKLQMCGSKSMETGNEAAATMIRIINESVTFVKNAHRREQTYFSAYKWLMRHCKGSEVDREIETLDEDMTITEEVKDYTVTWPDFDETPAPEKLGYFIDAFIERFDDLRYWSMLKHYAMYYYRITPAIISKKLKVTKVGRSMMNMNYKLGFPINRQLLNELLIQNGITSDYINTFHPFVSVQIVSDKADDELVVRREGTHSRQNFIIYQTGKIMHSGQGGEAMADCYYRMIAIMIRLKTEIQSLPVVKTSISAQMIKRPLVMDQVELNPEILMDIVKIIEGK